MNEKTIDTVETERPDCLLCGGTGFAPVLQRVRDLVWRRPGSFDLERCSACGLVMTRPRPTASALGAYYRDTYSAGQRRRFQSDSKLGRMIPRYRLQVLSRVHRLGPADRVLDVGCNYGAFLRAARLSSGCATTGVDIDGEILSGALDRDRTEYRAGRIETLDLPAHFSVITFYESLEHHADPLRALRRARELLAPGGIVVIEVPDFGGLLRSLFGRYWLPLLVPQHLVHFTRDTLTRAIEAAGFTQIEHAQSMFFPLEGIASLYFLLRQHLPRAARPLLLLALAAAFPLIELPSQALLRAIGRSGHQTLIARR